MADPITAGALLSNPQFIQAAVPAVQSYATVVSVIIGIIVVVIIIAIIILIVSKGKKKRAKNATPGQVEPTKSERKAASRNAGTGNVR